MGGSWPAAGDEKIWPHMSYLGIDGPCLAAGDEKLRPQVSYLGMDGSWRVVRAGWRCVVLFSLVVDGSWWVGTPAPNVDDEDETQRIPEKSLPQHRRFQANPV